MLIKNVVLDKMIKEKGRQYAKTMYINRKFDLTKKQLSRLLEEDNAKKCKNN